MMMMMDDKNDDDNDDDNDADNDDDDNTDSNDDNDDDDDDDDDYDGDEDDGDWFGLVESGLWHWPVCLIWEATANILILLVLPSTKSNPEKGIVAPKTGSFVCQLGCPILRLEGQREKEVCCLNNVRMHWAKEKKPEKGFCALQKGVIPKGKDDQELFLKARMIISYS